MKRLHVTLLMAMLAVMTATADTFTGCVVDETQGPTPFANVVLLNAVDSAFVAGTTTDANGVFTLTGSVAHPLIKISYLGYRTRLIDSPETN